MKYALLMLAACANLLPPLFASVLGGRVNAWEYVAYGMEAASLWLLVLAVLWTVPMRRGARMPLMAVAGWGFFEAMQRAGCRLMLPMDKAPSVPPHSGICDVALGWHISSLGLVFVGALIALVAHECRRD